MKNLLLFILLGILGSCGKDNDKQNLIDCVSSNLSSGTSSFYIRFYPDISNFKIYESKGVNTLATKTPMANSRIGYFIAGQIVNGTDIRTVELTFILPDNANTSNGSLIDDFGWNNGSTGMRPILTMDPGGYETGEGPFKITALHQIQLKVLFQENSQVIMYLC